MWWPWFELEAARDPLLSGERELLARVIGVATRAPQPRLSLAELDHVLGIAARDEVVDLLPEHAEVA